LVNWLLGGVSTRLEFLERDVEALQQSTRKLEGDQRGLSQVVRAHHAQLQQQADEMIALRRMHGLLTEKLGRPFPGQVCESCGGPLIFERAAAERAYALRCAQGCAGRLLLPESSLLRALDGGNAPSAPAPADNDPTRVP
jgi:hypothetical protein